MSFKNVVKGNEIIVYVDSMLYSKDGIFKCLYWYTEKYIVDISIIDNKTFKISLIPNSELNLSEDQLNDTLIKFQRDLVDFNLRDIVSKETKNIREILTAKAFSNGEFDEIPPGEITDPVGFNINEITND